MMETKLEGKSVQEFDSLVATAGSEAPVTEAPVIEPTTGVGDYALDMLKAVPAGVERGVIGARETVRAIGRAVLPESLQDEALQGPLTPGTASAETMPGKIVQDVITMGLGFVGGQRILKGPVEGVKGVIAASA